MGLISRKLCRIAALDIFRQILWKRIELYWVYIHLQHGLLCAGFFNPIWMPTGLCLSITLDQHGQSSARRECIKCFRCVVDTLQDKAFSAATVGRVRQHHGLKRGKKERPTLVIVVQDVSFQQDGNLSSPAVAPSSWAFRLWDNAQARLSGIYHLQVQILVLCQARSNP